MICFHCCGGFSALNYLPPPVNIRAECVSSVLFKRHCGGLTALRKWRKWRLLRWNRFYDVLVPCTQPYSLVCIRSHLKNSFCSYLAWGTTMPWFFSSSIVLTFPGILKQKCLLSCSLLFLINTEVTIHNDMFLKAKINIFNHTRYICTGITHFCRQHCCLCDIKSNNLIDSL